MSKPFTIAAIVVVATMAVGAQTTRVFMSLPSSWGSVQVERFIETDGDPTTTEVLIWRYVDYLWRVVAVKPDGTLCAGPWFTFIGDTMAWPRFKRVGGVDVVFLTESLFGPHEQTFYFEVALDHPTSCLP